MQGFVEKAKQNIQKIVFPEGADERIVEAVVKVKELGIATPIILGNVNEIKKIASKKGLSVDGISIVDPSESEDKINQYAKIYSETRGTKESIAKRLIKKPLSFGGMMVKSGDADGMVAGVASATSSVIQSASLTVGFQEGLSTPSSFFIMIIPEFLGEKNKVLLFSDCAVAIQPDAKQLAEIGVASGMNAKGLLGMDPKIAFLSFSTKGSASHADADKVLEALEIAKKLKPEFDMDGELQADSAIVPKVAAKKVKESKVAGKANVLIFPDLDAANTAYKLVQYTANAKAIGPILQGFAKPVNDMSRGASVDDLIGVTAVTVVQAQNS